MWGHLRAASVFYIRIFEEEAGMSTEEVSAAFATANAIAQDHLRQYAILAERHFGHQLCKQNLHKLSCQLPIQQARCGHAAWSMEFWIEMMVQFCKRYTKFLTTSTPELLLVNQLLLSSALTNASALHEGLKTFDELVPAWGGDPEVVRGSWLDTQDDNGEGFLGSGSLITNGEEQSQVDAILAKLYEEFPDTPCKPDPTGVEDRLQFQHSDMLRYVSAHRGGVETVHSTAYKRTRLRESFYVKVRYEEPVTDARGRGVLDAEGEQMYEEVLYIGKVRYFLGALTGGYSDDMITPDGQPPQKVDLAVRIAATDLFKGKLLRTDLGDLVEVKDWTRPKHSLYPVALGKMDYKVVRCAPLQHSSRAKNRMVFVPYTHTKFDRD
jgi:hypothetical protein